VIGSAPVERAGAAAAVSETSSEFGGALGIAILGSIGTAVYRTRMTDALPTSVAPDLLEPARSTLASAVTLAEQLPGTLGAEVLETARLAFARSFDVTALLTAAVALITAGMVLFVRRGDTAEDALARDNEPMGVAHGLNPAC
jgi:MFS transporter, DHA2 family, multidrug resistance protein